MTDTYTVAIVPAAGAGKRMGGGTAKQFLPLLGVPILGRTLRLLQAAPELDAVVVVAPADAQDIVAQLAREHACTKLAAVVMGGAERQDSVLAGLSAIRNLLFPAARARRCVVAIHDAARPLLPEHLLSGILSAALEHPAQVMAVPVKDTIKIAGPDGSVKDTPARSNLWAAQTPQVFDLQLIWQAHRQAATDGFLGTDDAQLVERLGVPVRIFAGSQENIKLTTPEDVLLAEAILRRREA